MRSRNEYNRKALAVFSGVLLGKESFLQVGKTDKSVLIVKFCLFYFIFFLSAAVVAAQSWCRIRKLFAFFLYLKIFCSACLF